MRAHGGSLIFAYTSALKGFAARLRNPLVAYIEPDRVFRVDATQSRGVRPIRSGSSAPRRGRAAPAG